MLAALLVVGSFVAGSVVDRFRGQDLPAPTLPTTVQRSTPAPAPTDQQAPRPTATPGFASGWNDLGDLSDAFGARTVMSVMPGPDGGLVAFGRDRISELHRGLGLGRRRRLDRDTNQPGDVFADAVPTTGALGGPGMLVIGSAVSTARRHSALSGSRATAAPGPSHRTRRAELQTNADRPDHDQRARGRHRLAAVGHRVGLDRRRDLDARATSVHQGVSDVSVDADGFVAVGQSGSNAFLVTSTDGRTWGTPQRPGGPAGHAGGHRAVERRHRSRLDRRPALAANGRRGWRAVTGCDGAQGARRRHSVVGGQTDLVAIGSPSRRRHVSGVDLGRQRVTGLSDQQAAEAGSGAPTVVAVAPHGHRLVRADPAWHASSMAGCWSPDETP